MNWGYTTISTLISNNTGGIRLPINFYVDGATQDDTYFFTAFGYNLGNFNGTVSRNRDRLIYAENNHDWVEQIGIISGINKDSNVYVPNDLKSYTAIETFTQNPNTHVLYAAPVSMGDRSYESGEVIVANGNELKTMIKSYFAMGTAATNTYLLPDGITHNYTSSSGYYGKIELNTEGKWNSDGSLPTNSVSKQPATLLYGGRYVANKNTVAVDEKRTYDVPYGKDVTYKMTPEKDYIIDDLYIDGVKIDNSDINFKTVYENDGYTVKYYTYTFPGDTLAGDLSDPNFDPRSGKGGSAHTIHVTWQPTVNIEFSKVWDDFYNLYELRPTKLPITLKQNGNNYRNVLDTSLELFYNPNEPSIPKSFPYDLTGDSKNPVWEYKWLDGTTETKGFMRLPMYSDYDEINDLGTLYQYTIEETLPNELTDYYIERQPHLIVKEDTDVNQSYLANNEKPDKYTESGLIYGSHREMLYEITNELKYTELFIEKAVISGNATFKFKVDLKNSDLKVNEFDDFKKKADSEYEKTISGPGNSLIKNGNEIIASRLLLPNTEYTVTEILPSNWEETASSKASSHTGEIFDSSSIFGYRNVKNSEIYIPEGTGYVDRNGDPISLPSETIVSRYFDDNGIEMEKSSSSSTGYVYKGGDRKEVPSDFITKIVTIDYAAQSTLEGDSIVYKATKTGDNGVTKEEDILVAKPIYGVWFENKKKPVPYNPPKTGD